ncbi:enoyl-CoA hydratase/isomerase family protein [Chelatococcus sp. GCM10030263]|uniref:enoyl-CoA hydratase/isomerase family protein n=1 Tax=Chelatococcus sp. GCM10030263 TaxID=3273387 RepID=UPI003617D4DC
MSEDKAKPVVSLAIEGAVARIRIANPPLNILTTAVRRALFETAGALADRRDLGVIVIESDGARAFSVGSDIREFPDDELGGVAKIRFEQYLYDRIAGLPQVVIAKLRGLALGGGGELMLACDLRVAASTAEFGFPEIKLGALPAAGGIKRLVQEVGPAMARSLIMTGRPISAARALDIGLINEVVEEGELDARVDSLAAELAGLPREALRLAKACVAAAVPSGAIDTAEAEAFGALFRTGDLREGVAAFLEKRQPRFNR